MMCDLICELRDLWRLAMRRLQMQDRKMCHHMFHMQFQYRGSIEYCDTLDGIVIVARISGIAQH